MTDLNPFILAHTNNHYQSMVPDPDSDSFWRQFVLEQSNLNRISHVLPIADCTKTSVNNDTNSNNRIGPSYSQIIKQPSTNCTPRPMSPSLDSKTLKGGKSEEVLDDIIFNENGKRSKRPLKVNIETATKEITFECEKCLKKFP